MVNEVIVQKIEPLISNLSLEELCHINHIIVERIKHLKKINALSEMSKFRIGQMVSFTTDDGRLITGNIQKLNQKTVTIITLDNYQWNVSPQLLMRKV